MMRRILVIGGTHGNELLGVKMVESLRQNPINGVDVILANPRAVRSGVRFTESDLNRSFGAQERATYEVARARELQVVTNDYDIVLDFHNTQTPGNNCSFVGEACDPVLYDVAKTLGFSTCIEATYDCINKYCPTTISIEVSIGDMLDDVDIWREKIADLANSESLKTSGVLKLYRFCRRVTWEEKRRFRLESWQPFVAISRNDATVLGVEPECAPIFVGSQLTEYYATLLVRGRDV